MRLNLNRIKIFSLLPVIFFIITATVINADNAVVRLPEKNGRDNVLLINSYHKGLSWTDSLTSAIEKNLKQESRSELFIEYLDAKRFTVEAYENEFYNLIRKRYKNIKFKAVIVCDNNALLFAKRYRAELFPETPVIFCGINNYSDDLIDRSGWFTGVVEKTDAEETFNIMKKINPEMRNCIVIGDSTPTGKAEIAAARESLGDVKNGVKIKYWVNLSTASLLKRLGGLNSKNEAVLLTVFNRDADGRYYDYEESSRLITDNTSARVFGLWDFYIGNGVVGGEMVNAADQGNAAAAMVLRILKGEDHQNISIKRESPNRLLFDYASLRRFNIDMTSLPEGGIILNKPSNFIRDNLWIITATLLLIVSEGTALLLLFRFLMKSRKKAMKDIEESEKKYRMLVDNSFDVIYQINANGVYTFVSPSWSIVLGHEVGEVIGRNFTEFIHPEDSGSVIEFLLEVITSDARHSGVDYRVCHADGSWRVHTSSIMPVRDDSGSVAAFVGIAKDITERKNSENEVKKLLEEKELLLKEVHHRIKNNMGTISSLLYLQKDVVRNSNASEALDDARNRVQSMMVIYDKLYRSSDFRSISAKDYLADLITGVSATFAGASKVRVETEIEDAALDSEILFPVGIIVNELLSNAYKYAFHDKKEGVVSVSFLLKTDKTIELVFSDNGPGVPVGVISGETSGFGMSLVRILIKQIRGNLFVTNNNGTEYRITFPF